MVSIVSEAAGFYQLQTHISEEQGNTIQVTDLSRIQVIVIFGMHSLIGLFHGIRFFSQP